MSASMNGIRCLPQGQLSEEAQECRNKDFKRFRGGFSRKISRVATNMDVLNMLLVTSDILIASCEKHQRKPSTCWTKPSWIFWFYWMGMMKVFHKETTKIFNVHVKARTHMHTRTCSHTYIHAHTHTRTPACIHTHVHTYNTVTVIFIYNISELLLTWKQRFTDILWI